MIDVTSELYGTNAIETHKTESQPGKTCAKEDEDDDDDYVPGEQGVVGRDMNMFDT